MQNMTIAFTPELADFAKELVQYGFVLVPEEIAARCDAYIYRSTSPFGGIERALGLLNQSHGLLIDVRDQSVENVLSVLNKGVAMARGFD